MLKDKNGKKKNMFIRKMFCIINVSGAGLSGPKSSPDSWFNQRWSLLRLYPNNTSLQPWDMQVDGKLTNESALKTLTFIIITTFLFYLLLLLSYEHNYWVVTVCLKY